MRRDAEVAGNGWLPDLYSDERWRELGTYLGLPRRQQQIARLVCRGCSNRQIALHLGIAPDTVRMHLKALFERLGVHERVGVAVRLILADRQGAIERGTADECG